MIPVWASELSIIVVGTENVVAIITGVAIVVNAVYSLVTSYNPEYEGWTDSEYQRAEIVWVLRHNSAESRHPLDSGYKELVLISLPNAWFPSVNDWRDSGRFLWGFHRSS